jgi:hypothetical protein
MYQATIARRLSKAATQGSRLQWTKVSSSAPFSSLVRPNSRENEVPSHFTISIGTLSQSTASSNRFFSAQVASKGPTHSHLEVEEVQSLFHLWNDALATLDPVTVSKRYTKVPYLLPTISNIPRTDVPSIVDYFETFLKLKPQGVVTESFVTTGENWCSDCGLYEFTLGADGSKVKARFTFIYAFEDGEWKIAHHHSSAMPEKDV